MKKPKVQPEASGFNPLLGMSVEIGLHHADMPHFSEVAARLQKLTVLDHPFVTRLVTSKTTDVNDDRAPIQAEVIEYGYFTLDLKIPLNDLLTWLEQAQEAPRG